MQAMNMQQATKSQEALKWQSLLWHNKKSIYLTF